MKKLLRLSWRRGLWRAGREPRRPPTPFLRDSVGRRASECGGTRYRVSPTVQRDRLWTGILVIGGLLALAAAILGLIIGIGDDWDSTGDRALWLSFTLGGALLLIAGLWYATRSRRVGAALIIIGALLCGIAVFWSIAMPLAAIVLVVLTIMWVRRPAAAL